jgi:hypothetical protein
MRKAWGLLIAFVAMMQLTAAAGPARADEVRDGWDFVPNFRQLSNRDAVEALERAISALEDDVMRVHFEGLNLCLPGEPQLPGAGVPDPVRVLKYPFEQLPGRVVLTTTEKGTIGIILARGMVARTEAARARVLAEETWLKLSVMNREYRGLIERHEARDRAARATYTSADAACVANRLRRARDLRLIEGARGLIAILTR